MTFDEVVTRTEEQATTLVWWSPDQVERGEDIENNPKKGNRPWSVPRQTGEFLHAAVLEREPSVVLELGTSIGYSTLWIAGALATYGGTMRTVENMRQKFEIAKQNVHDAGLDATVTLHQEQISDVLARLDTLLGGAKIGIVFMDADRGHYHEYFPMLKEHLADDALIIADNAGNMGGRMQPFFDLLTKEGWEWHIKDMDNGLLIATQ